MQSEPIEQGGLNGQEDRKHWAGVVAVLGDHMQLRQHLGAEMIDFVDDQQGADLAGCSNDSDISPSFECETIARCPGNSTCYATAGGGHSAGGW